MGAVGQGSIVGDGAETRNLIALAMQGDQQAWFGLYERHRIVMRLFLRGRIPTEYRGRFDTEEVLSSGFLAAFEKLGQFQYRGADSFQRWIAEILANKLRDKIRFNSCRKRDARRDNSLTVDVSPTDDHAETESPSVLLLEAEQQAKVLAGLDLLAPDDQALISLRAIDHLPWGEVAAKLSISTSTARRRYGLALQKLVEGFKE
jgi:RNA polymerase sigma factor (sigma-70 family)